MNYKTPNIASYMRLCCDLNLIITWFVRGYVSALQIFVLKVMGTKMLAVGGSVGNSAT